VTPFDQNPADPIAALARALLYKGYVLWPNRRSTLKNQRRWTFGGVFPRAYSEAGHADDACLMRTECLVEATPGATLDVTVRFLHVVRRTVARMVDGVPAFADSITIAGETFLAWEEAVEREVLVPTIYLGSKDPLHVRVPVQFQDGESIERLRDAHGDVAGLLVHRWKHITGFVDVYATRLLPGVHKLCVDITNTSPWNGEPRHQVLPRTFVSTHTVLRAGGGALVSLVDPPRALAALAGQCENLGTWPVLVGRPPMRDTVLSSPIILSDYPEVAPESSTDFFDGAEIDQLLVLGVLSMTEEQRLMSEAHPRTRVLLEHCRPLSPDDVVQLHGVTRGPPAILS
jgi:hypothetical protein